MKKAVIIDQKKLDRIREKIKTDEYIDYAINHLAYEISIIYR